jgi:hypothetical protein
MSISILVLKDGMNENMYVPFIFTHYGTACSPSSVVSRSLLKSLKIKRGMKYDESATGVQAFVDSRELMVCRGDSYPPDSFSVIQLSSTSISLNSFSIFVTDHLETHPDAVWLISLFNFITKLKLSVLPIQNP